jgi:hypothetical protein
MPNFGHSEVLNRMTDETPLLLAPKDKFVTLNIFDTVFCRFAYKRGLVYGMCWYGCTRWTRFLYWWISLRGQSWCRRILWHFECQGIICLMLSCYSLSIRSIRFLACSEYCILEGIVNREISMCSDSRTALLALNRMMCLPVLYHSAEILFRNWLCLTEFDWCGYP